MSKVLMEKLPFMKYPPLSDADCIKLAGQHVCTAHFGSAEVITSNKDPKIARAMAKQKGCSDPVTFYVPLPGENLIPPGIGLRR